jgi:hypothetical protein
LFVNGYFASKGRSERCRWESEVEINVDPEIEKAPAHRNACGPGKIGIYMVFGRTAGDNAAAEKPLK